MCTIKFVSTLAIFAIAIVALSFIFAGCGRQQAELEQKKNIIRNIIEEAYNKGNLAILDEVLSADYICHQIPYKDRNLESYKELCTGWRSLYPDTKFAITSMVAEGDKVTVLATYEGTNIKTGKHVSGPGLILFRWKDKKIVESWDIWDELGYHRQLGYKIIPPVTDSTFARVTVTQVKPEKMEEVTNIYRESVVPEAKKQKGFRGIYSLRDSKTGKGLSIAIWDSEADAIANEQSGYYKAQVDKFKDFFTAKLVREGYIVTVQE